MKKYISILFIGLITAVASCTDPNETEVSSDNFDRGAMLANWADNIIVPGYVNYVNELAELKTAKDNFISSTTTANLEALRAQWLDAYIAWQYVSIFEIGKAEELTLRDFTNVFPTDVTTIEENISTGVYNLQLPSSRVAQGFPALDYLLFGSALTDQEILARFNNEQALKVYLSDVTDRLNTLGTTVLEDWNNGYRDIFVDNDGSSATSSVNKLVNDYMFYYEKALRAGKVGIPAGVFSTSPLSDKVEGLHSKVHSKTLFNAALIASENFFNGTHFDGQGSGESLKSYLDFMNEVTQGESIAALINQQFDNAKLKASELDNNFYQQVETGNQLMLETYDELQKNVVLMKVDMFQALSISVTYTDADGD